MNRKHIFREIQTYTNDLHDSPPWLQLTFEIPSRREGGVHTIGSRGRFENGIDLVSRLEIETRNGRRSCVWVLERTHVHRTDDSSLAMFSKS